MTINVKNPSPYKHRQFASDNYAGATPEAWSALEHANAGHAPSYGEDEWTARASKLIREIFEFNCEVYFTFNGTAANSLALAAMCQPYNSIICHQMAHIETDECGGPEFYSSGAKILGVPGKEGKLNAASVRERATSRENDIHYSKPKVVSVTQSTELGTVYRADELSEIVETARSLGLRIHMDGSRFANALATLQLKPKEITWEIGVDVLCLGGTKLGMPVGDVVVFFDHALAQEFGFRCKQAGHLASKMRYLAAPWVGMLKDGAWLRHAAHTNEMAQYMVDEITQIPGVNLLMPVEANAVFVELPIETIDAMRDQDWHFYTFIGTNGIRLVSAWDTTREDVDAFVSDLRSHMVHIK